MCQKNYTIINGRDGSNLHNLPKAMHGSNILNENCNLVSFNDALVYAKGCMDEKMKQEYREYFG